MTMCNVSGAHRFSVKSVSPAYIAHFLAQDLHVSHILHVFLVGVLLFTPYSTGFEINFFVREPAGN